MLAVFDNEARNKGWGEKAAILGVSNDWVGRCVCMYIRSPNPLTCCFFLWRDYWGICTVRIGYRSPESRLDDQKHSMPNHNTRVTHNRWTADHNTRPASISIPPSDIRVHQWRRGGDLTKYVITATFLGCLSLHCTINV